VAFVLGVSLTVSGLGNVAAQIVWERDISPRWTSDWQDTDNFRWEASNCLKDFLTIGAGGKLDLYDSYMYDEAVEGGIVEAIEQSRADFGLWPEGPAGSGMATTDSSVSNPAAPAKPEDQAPDAGYKDDKNVLYYIAAKDGKTYSNSNYSASLQKGSVEGCNLYLTFQNGKVSITKDGVNLDVYGSGVYEGDPQWFVPGYANFPATDQLDGVTVYMAVRQTPIRYYGVDYQTGSSYNRGSFYYIAQQVERSRTFYLTQAMVLGWGVLCLAAWFFLRKSTEPVNRKIASWTVHVWTEARFLLVLACLLLGFLPGFVNLSSIYDLFYYSYWDGCYWDGEYSLSGWAIGFARLLLSNIPALLTLIWLVWLIHNDHRYNPKEDRRSLLRPFLRSLRARDLKRSVEKRISRMAGAFGLTMVLLVLEIILFLVMFTVVYSPWPIWMLWTLFLLPVLLAAALTVRAARRQGGLAKDIARLADQIEAVRAGDLSKPLELPKDSDLRQTAESLNDIQAGMETALEEQIRSERMKVELVSNVSHDLKTPLTSILSYAELLRQEGNLPPAAADYARIIDEKARRLKGMVEDVFEVSKAAANQLPIQLERLDLAKLLRQTLADMDGAIQQSALTFKVDLPETPVMITADGKRLYRVFQNLIDNALRYALEGSRVYLTLKTSAGQAEASVRNTSRTELPEDVDFTARFVRGDASRTDGGSGLGLSIASSFTEACGGTFRVETVADLFTAIVTFHTVE